MNRPGTASSRPGPEPVLTVPVPVLGFHDPEPARGQVYPRLIPSHPRPNHGPTKPSPSLDMELSTLAITPHTPSTTMNRPGTASSRPGPEPVLTVPVPVLGFHDPEPARGQVYPRLIPSHPRPNHGPTKPSPSLDMELSTLAITPHTPSTTRL
ncbi:hypothetical protein F511_44114 [Dorcoceras hygrometricum]|uniref:Uncharacterized protein n=1 Tax=Dorcoceras hygrometricum TaxID=472368 RepID=A0A2Z7CB18_9LAMI|nr:hypothetical protein F511_44114 [Dorcoceras hygrometricum]